MDHTFTPDNDGINHIRIGVDGVTDLGKKLCLGYPRKFTIDGQEYASILAYWVSASISKQTATFGTQHNNSHLRQLTSSNFFKPAFTSVDLTIGRSKTIETIKEVYSNDVQLMNEIKSCDLPFAMYSILSPSKIYPSPDGWYIDLLNELKNH